MHPVHALQENQYDSDRPTLEREHQTRPNSGQYLSLG